jgi:hypothetical protein
MSNTIFCAAAVVTMLAAGLAPTPGNANPVKIDAQLGQSVVVAEKGKASTFICVSRWKVLRLKERAGAPR